MQYEALDEAREKINQLRENKFLSFAKYMAAAIAGLLFFSGGFFAGQTVALAIGSLFTLSAASLFWPVLVVSLVVGLAAFGVYWFVERPGIENLVSRWYGLEQEKIDAFSDEEIVATEKDWLSTLEEKIKDFAEKLENAEHSMAVKDAKIAELELALQQLQGEKEITIASASDFSPSNSLGIKRSQSSIV